MIMPPYRNDWDLDEPVVGEHTRERQVSDEAAFRMSPLVIQQTSKSKIGNMQLPIARQKQILRFDIAMNHSLLVCVLQPLGNSRNKFCKKSITTAPPAGRREQSPQRFG